MLFRSAYYEQAVPPKAALKGFRVGHVSREVAIQKMGGPKAFFEPLYAEVAKGLLAKRGFEAAVFDNLRLEGNEKEGYTLRATVYKTPQVILPEDLSFLGEIVVPPVDELAVQSLIDKAVKATLGNFAVIEPAGEPAGTGHRVTIKCTTKSGKKIVPERTGIFSAMLEPDSNLWWLNLVVGLKEGDSISKSMVDDDEKSRFFDKTLNFQIDVQAVQKVILPLVNDKVLEKVGFTSESAWRKALEERYRKLARESIDSQVVQKAIDAILQKAEVEPIPMLWIELMAKNFINGIKRQMGETKMLEAYGESSIDKLTTKLGIQFFVKTRDELVLRSFAKRIGMGVSDDRWRGLAEKQLANFVRDFSLEEKTDEEEKKSE